MESDSALRLGLSFRQFVNNISYTTARQSNLFWRFLKTLKFFPRSFRAKQSVSRGNVLKLFKKKTLTRS